MTQDELDALLRRNPALSIGDSGKAAEPKRIARDAALGATQAKVADSQRFLVSITSVRRRLLDEDNLVSKYHTDLCRYAGVIPSDAPGICEIQTRQRKAAKGEEEHTQIAIYELNK